MQLDEASTQPVLNIPDPDVVPIRVLCAPYACQANCKELTTDKDKYSRVSRTSSLLLLKTWSSLLWYGKVKWSWGGSQSKRQATDRLLSDGEIDK